MSLFCKPSKFETERIVYVVMSCFASGVAADALPLAADALPALCIVVDLSILKHQCVCRLCRAVNFNSYWLLGMNQDTWEISIFAKQIVGTEITLYSGVG